MGSLVVLFQFTFESGQWTPLATMRPFNCWRSGQASREHRSCGRMPTSVCPMLALRPGTTLPEDDQSS